MDPVNVAQAYKTLLMVEDTFRTAKTILENLHEVELQLQNTTFLLRSSPCGHAAHAIRATLRPTIRLVA